MKVFRFRSLPYGENLEHLRVGKSCRIRSPKSILKLKSR